MAHILKNEKLTMFIDWPQEHYQGSRFDWTGKIRMVEFKGKLVSGTELMEAEKSPSGGKGFYNEFGIDTALG